MYSYQVIRNPGKRALDDFGEMKFWNPVHSTDTISLPGDDTLPRKGKVTEVFHVPGTLGKSVLFVDIVEEG